MRLPIALCALLLVVGCQSEEERRSDHARRAAEYYDAEQWNEAKIEYLNLLQIDANDAEANYKLAEVQRRIGEYGDALWRYREAVRLDPGQASWRARLAALLFQARQPDEAREQLDAALEIEPENAEALVLRARIHVADEENERAVERLDEVLVLTSDFAPESEDLTEDQQLVRVLRQAAYTMKAQLEIHDQRFDAAEATLRAFTRDFDRAGPHLVLAVFLVDREREADAQVEYLAAVAAAKEEDERLRAQFSMAAFLASRDDIEGAERVLVKAREASPERQEPLVQLASLYAREGRNEEAAAMLEEVAAQQPDSARPLMALANFLRLQGEKERALEAVERALAREPDNEQARLARAEFLMDLRDQRPGADDEARAIVDQVLEDNPESTLGIFTKAKFELIDGENEAAANHLRRVVQERPLALAHVMLATAYQRLGQPDLARSELLAAIRLDESNLIARRSLAQLHMEAGNWTLALQESEAALRRNPGDSPLVLLRARAFAANRQLAEAKRTLDGIEYAEGEGSHPLRIAAALLWLQLGEGEKGSALIEQVLAEDPTNPAALRIWASQRARAGEGEVALARIDAAIEESPDRAELYELRAAIALASGAPPEQRQALRERVLRDIDTAIEKDPTRADPWVLKANVYRIGGEYDEADAALSRAIELDSGHVEAFVMRAELLERRGETERALRAYEELLEAHPNHTMAKNNLAWLLADADSPTPEQLDRAQDLAQDAKEAAPDNAAIADTLGWVMLKKRIPRAAIPLFREGIGKSPDSVTRATIRYHLALAYEQAGESQKAIAELEIAIAEDQNFADRAQAESALSRMRAG
jgi:tetratricopeptide (TPR) repeat protein